MTLPQEDGKSVEAVSTCRPVVQKLAGQLTGAGGSAVPGQLAGQEEISLAKLSQSSWCAVPISR